MSQPLRKTLWRLLKKLNIEVPCNPAAALLGVYLRELETCSHKNMYAVFIAALFIIAKPRQEGHQDTRLCEGKF